MRVHLPSGAPIVVAVLMAAALLAGRETTPQACDADRTCSWPESNPSGSCAGSRPPTAAGVDGMGVEMASVFYNGKLVMSRGQHAGAEREQDPGGCGGTDLTCATRANELSAPSKRTT